MKKISILVFAAVCFFLTATNPVQSAEYPGPFTIKSITVSSATNYHFRLQSNGSSWLCLNGETNPPWAYINEADSGAKGKIATLLTAYSLGKTVTVVTEGVVVGSSTYCHILDFLVSD